MNKRDEPSLHLDNYFKLKDLIDMYIYLKKSANKKR
jgi:hypothetical protein